MKIYWGTSSAKLGQVFEDTDPDPEHIKRQKKGPKAVCHGQRRKQDAYESEVGVTVCGGIRYLHELK